MDLQSYEAVTCSLIYDLQLGRSPNVFSCGESNANELEQRVLALTLGSAHEKNHVFVLITSLPPWFNANDS